MKKSKFTEQQIAFILKQVDDGVSVGSVSSGRGRMGNPEGSGRPGAIHLFKIDALL